MSRVIVTPAQAKALMANQRQAPLFGEKPKQAPRAPHVKKRKEDLPENQVESACLDFLRHRGWLVLRQQSGVFVPMWAVKKMQETGEFPSGVLVRVGAKGMCDYRAERPRRGEGSFDCFELEIKAAGQKPKPDQITYMYERNALGFVAVWFDGISNCASPLADWYHQRFET